MTAATAIPTTRLVDYFAVIGFDDSKERNGVSVGRILQRFPGSDWPDVPFFQGLELFCQPQGWKLSSKKLAPTFFISVLTDIGADRHYVACLSFYEPRFSLDNSSSLNDVEDDDEILNNSTATTPDANSTGVVNSIVNSHAPLPVMYSPKCLVLVSRHEYFEVFRNCLGTIYTVYIDKLAFEFENLVATLVSGIQVPPAGGPQVNFSLGANDRQAIQPAVSATVPVTQKCIAVLFQQLGIFNVICLFCAALTDRKILFNSQSYTRLTDACHALSSLIFPLKYSYVYVPLLPGSLIEVLHSPTPFIMGLHSSFKSQVTDLYEVILVDVDSGSVYIPESIAVPPLPEPYHSRLLTCLTLVLNRELFTADFAFGSSANRNVPLNILDKQIRACFLRLFADLFTDYRACLRVVRIHPKPFITFHKAAFLGLRGFQEDDFMSRLLDSMSFQSFIADRGVPYRVCDIFDDVYASIERILQEENENVDKIIDNIVMLAQQLQDNECPNNMPFLHKVPQPNDANMNAVVPPTFPHLDGEKINAAIEENVAKLPPSLPFVNSNGNGGHQWCRMAQLREVPINQKRQQKYLKSQQFSGNLRRLDVLKHCLRCIFENKISDARKMLSAVLLSMKSSVVRVAFCQELYSCLHLQNRATLEAQQFDLVVRLMNCALQNDTVADEYGVAYAMLSLATTYCRRLSTGVMQFAYTCVQDHAVWKNQQFWEASFYHDVHLQLKDLYAVVGEGGRKSTSTPFGTIPSRDVWNLYEEPCVLKLTADKIKNQAWASDAELKEMKNQEEAIIYSQAIHYANRIVYFVVPMDGNRLRRVNVQSLEDSSNASVSNVSRQSADDISTTESDVESGFIEGEGGGNGGGGDLGQGTVRYISKFLDKVCCESGVGADRLRQLHLIIPGVVAMHIETLEHVHKESKKLPPIHKPRMLVPAFLPGEQMLQGYLRVYLMPDGRTELLKSPDKTHSNSFLPAEGAIFLTNYRIIFKGQPCDPYICEKVVMRVIPVMAMTKEKRIGQQFLSPVDQSGHYLHDALQIRSATFQLMKVAFDEEVSPDKVQNFCQALEQLRWPEEVSQMFALSFGASTLLPSATNAVILPKDKSGTIKGMVKGAWKKTAKKAGFNKQPKLKTKMELSHVPSSNKSSFYGIREQQNSPKRQSPASDDDTTERQTPTQERSSVDFATHQSSKMPLTRTLDRLSERSYCQDYQRLGLCTRVEVTLHTGGTLNKSLTRTSSEGAFRLTVVNRSYAVCRSYPAVVAVPSKISDDSLKKIAKGHKHGRFPVVTWCSDRGALLVRSAGFHVRSVVSRLKQQATYQTAQSGLTATSQPSGGMKSSIEQERYFSNLVSLSPNVPLNGGSHLSSSMGSLLSLDSLLLNFDTASVGSATPDTYRKPLSGVGQFQKAMGMRSSGGAGQQKTMTMRLGLRPAGSRTSTMTSTSTLSATPRMGSNAKRLSTMAPDIYGGGYYRDPGVAQSLHRASLYIFGEKTQAKTLKLDPKCEFIPVDYPESHDAKEALKKFLRVTAPSNPPSGETNYVHLKALDESGWFQQIKALLQVSNAIVDIIDLHNSSVAVCLEYGWDATTQIVSLAQVMLDPYYRTLDGFRILIEKEWLSFGHRFSHRCNHTFLSAASGFAPIFLQFLDAVHQIQTQYPAAFEFNDFYLRFLAYHSTAAYFRTFLMDCEADRVESGLLQFDSKPRPRPEIYASDESNCAGDNNSPLMKRNSLGRSTSFNVTSLWEYIAEKHRRSCIFYNFSYAPSTRSRILRPQFSVASLDLWDYYLLDPLSHGSTYDLEVADTELQERQTDQSEMTDSTSFTNPTRRLIDANYDSVDFGQPNAFKTILDDINNLERELDVLPQHWEQVLLKVRQNLERNEEESAQISATGEWARWLSRAWHKKSTIELLLRGRLASRGSAGGQRVSQTENGEQHNFQKYNFTTPEHCHVCNRVLWGIMKQGLRCVVCEFSCHDKCASVAPQNCHLNRTFIIGGGGAGGGQKSPQNSAAQLGFDNQSGSDRLSQNFDNFTSQPVETRTHEGYLMKRGALLKAWKQRWFVLDSIKHQLRYYDAMEDSHCKGYIDLAEITGIGAATPPPGSPKQLEGAFFDLKTPRRVYNFLANNQRDAQEWIEKIQACLQ